jgi:glucose-1-phosphate thymidylyltransferase
LKGVLLAGGTGSRLLPATRSVSKQLLTVYDKPMIYYSLSILMLSEITEIAVITTIEEASRYRELLGDGSSFGINIVYIVQEKPNGIAESLILCEEFIDTDTVCLMLGDNLFWGQGLSPFLIEASKINKGAFVFAKEVSDPSEFGVVDFDSSGLVISIEEKPVKPKSNYAVTGLYFYDNTVVSRAKLLEKSGRGELEITDINTQYVEEKTMHVELLGRGFAWLDTGNPNALLDASNFIRSIQSQHNYIVACLEEIAYQKKWIGVDELKASAKAHRKTRYGEYLAQLAES